MAWNSGPLTTKQIVDQNLPNPLWKKALISSNETEKSNTSEVYRQTNPPNVLEDALYNSLNRFASKSYMNKNQSINDYHQKSIKDHRKDDHNSHSHFNYGVLKKISKSPKRENLLSAAAVLKKLNSPTKFKKKIENPKLDQQALSPQKKLNVQKIVINVSQGKVFHRQECDRNQPKSVLLNQKIASNSTDMDTRIITLTKKIKQEPLYSEAGCSEDDGAKFASFKEEVNAKCIKTKLIHVDHIVTCCGNCKSDLNHSISSSRFCLRTGNVSVTCQSCGTVTLMYRVYQIPKL